MRALISSVYLYSKGSSGSAVLRFFCNLFSKRNKFLFKNRAILHTKYFFCEMNLFRIFVPLFIRNTIYSYLRSY